MATPGTVLHVLSLLSSPLTVYLGFTELFSHSHIRSSDSTSSFGAIRVHICNVVRLGALLLRSANIIIITQHILCDPQRKYCIAGNFSEH